MNQESITRENNPGNHIESSQKSYTERFYKAYYPNDLPVA